MEFPIEIQKLIKEFSMPIYKKPLHYKAYMDIFDKLPIESKTFNILKCRLRMTDYSSTNKNIKKCYL